jgi:hypothetical protein
MYLAYEEIVEFIAGGITPRSLIEFRPSEETRTHVAELIHRQKTSGIAPEEAKELDYFLKLEHIMRLAKARARQNLGSG